MRFKTSYANEDILATPLLFVLKRGYGLILAISVDKKSARVIHLCSQYLTNNFMNTWLFLKRSSKKETVFINIKNAQYI